MFGFHGNFVSIMFNSTYYVNVVASWSW